MTYFIVRKGWFRKRWHVYRMGHTEGEYLWVASFRYELAAKHWAEVG